MSDPTPVEVVVRLIPDSPRWAAADPQAVAAAAADAVDALLWAATLRGRGFRLASVAVATEAEVRG
jgi:hypothetical protein